MGRTGRILVVDDDAIARKDLAARLAAEGFEVETAADGFKALGKLPAFSPHVVVTDLKMPGMSGIELARKLLAEDDAPAVIVETGFGEVDSAIEAIRSGVIDYLAKPIDLGKLLAVLDHTIARQQLVFENRQLRQQLRERYAPVNIVGESAPMRRVFETIEQIAASSAPVLFVGESGTGKELLASAIHLRSPRAGKPQYTLHCGALSETLLAFELFGHERNAFAGATTRKDGLLQLADGGTLFLDEIAEIPPAIQVKLLRFLQDRSFERLGSTQPHTADVRLITATDRNLAAEVAARQFREDLFYRLGVVTIEPPPLRDRRGDIPLLAKFFLDRASQAAGKTFEGFADEAIERLVGYDWPGNVRELEAAIERAVIFAPGPLFDVKHLPPTIQVPSVARRVPRIPGATLAELTRYAILETLEATGGSTTRAAEILGISARTIQYKLHEYSEPARDSVLKPS